MRPGEEIPSLRLTPDPDAARRYAEAAGDYNPIHLDPAAAREAGLPAPILHGLYTMAQVARCTRQAGGGRRLQRLAVDFRALGFPAEEIEITGVVEDVSEETISLRLTARQGRRRLIRRASATLAAHEPAAAP